MQSRFVRGIDSLLLRQRWGRWAASLLQPAMYEMDSGDFQSEAQIPIFFKNNSEARVPITCDSAIALKKTPSERRWAPLKGLSQFIIVRRIILLRSTEYLVDKHLENRSVGLFNDLPLCPWSMVIFHSKRHVHRFLGSDLMIRMPFRSWFNNKTTRVYSQVILGERRKYVLWFWGFQALWGNLTWFFLNGFEGNQQESVRKAMSFEKTWFPVAFPCRSRLQGGPLIGYGWIHRWELSGMRWFIKPMNYIKLQLHILSLVLGVIGTNLAI